MLCSPSTVPEDNDERVDEEVEAVAILSDPPGCHNDQATNDAIQPFPANKSNAVSEHGGKDGET